MPATNLQAWERGKPTPTLKNGENKNWGAGLNNSEGVQRAQKHIPILIARFDLCT